MKEVRETKLVEQTTVRWFSDDGKEFNSERACYDYERRQKGMTIEEAYNRLKIAELEFPFQSWNGECNVELIKLRNYDDYVDMKDYLKWALPDCADISCKEPTNYPCLKVLVYDDYYASFAYEDNGINTMLDQCEKVMTIVEKAMMEV